MSTSFMSIWDGHIGRSAHAPDVGQEARDSRTRAVKDEPVVHVETNYDPGSMSAILMKFVLGYVVSKVFLRTKLVTGLMTYSALAARVNTSSAQMSDIFSAEKP